MEVRQPSPWVKLEAFSPDKTLGTNHTAKTFSMKLIRAGPLGFTSKTSQAYWTSGYFRPLPNIVLVLVAESVD
jgi:hypothetical protein